MEYTKEKIIVWKQQLQNRYGLKLAVWFLLGLLANNTR